MLLPGSEQPVELHFHDLRGTEVTLLSEAPCTPQQISTITGHSFKTVHLFLKRYLTRTRRLAEQVSKPTTNRRHSHNGKKKKIS